MLPAIWYFLLNYLVVEFKNTNLQEPDVKARFLLYDKNTGELCSDDGLWSKLVQPKNATLNSLKELTVTVPPQDEMFLKNLRMSNIDLYITMVQTSDGTGRLASGFQNFEYHFSEFGMDTPILGTKHQMCKSTYLNFLGSKQKPSNWLRKLVRRVQLFFKTFQRKLLQ